MLAVMISNGDDQGTTTHKGSYNSIDKSDGVVDHAGYHNPSVRPL